MSTLQLFEFSDGTRKVCACDINQVFKLCYQRKWDLREWGQFVAAKRGWLGNLDRYVVDVHEYVGGEG